MTSIFQIDWIFVDTIIIILLLLLLSGVKIFKITHRWRNSFSNQSLKYKSFSQLRDKAKSHFILTKKWYLTWNSTLKESNLPFILLFRKNYKRKVLMALAEGLCSYGFIVIIIKAKFKHLPDKAKLEKAINDEWDLLISLIIDEVKLTEVILNFKYIVINFSKSVISHKVILSDANNLGIILINPKLIKEDFFNHNDYIKNKASSALIYAIFSSKSNLFLNNRHLTKFQKEITSQKSNNLKYLTIRKATYSFKYYETILLGMIIDIIENKLLKSKT